MKTKTYLKMFNQSVNQLIKFNQLMKAAFCAVDNSIYIVKKIKKYKFNLSRDISRNLTRKFLLSQIHLKSQLREG